MKAFQKRQSRRIGKNPMYLLGEEGQESTGIKFLQTVEALRSMSGRLRARDGV